MGGVDLDRFQFDFDMTWAAFFMNTDLTIYGRYGSRNDHGPASSALLSVSSLKHALERALEIHRGYPANREALAGKQGRPAPWSRPERIPGLAKHAKRAKPPERCIHCHHVPQGERRTVIDRKQLLTEKEIWVYPFPENVGLEIDVADGRTVKKVRAGSFAAQAGARAGDIVETMNGQPIVSIADMQWVLHHLPATAELKLGVAREGKSMALTLPLAGDWRHTNLSWRASFHNLRLGLRLEDLTAAERKRAGLPADTLALRVERVMPNHVSRQSGVKRGDVIVEVAGRTDRWDESEFVAHIRTAYAKGKQVRIVLLRGGRRIRHRLRVG
jgi:hypothetical protein